MLSREPIVVPDAGHLLVDEEPVLAADVVAELDSVTRPRTRQYAGSAGSSVWRRPIRAAAESRPRLIGTRAVAAANP